MKIQAPGFKPAGDSALMVYWDAPVTPELNRYITRLKYSLVQAGIVGITDIVPAYATLLVYYDPAVTGYSLLCGEISGLLAGGDGLRPVMQSNKTVVIPVFYGRDYGPDLDYIAGEKGLTPGEVIGIHSRARYYVYMIGFLPGFPYLGFVDQRIAMGRRGEPRSLVPAGSVGIAGRQTGIYSLASPGGWQIIGRTPVRLFKPEKKEFLLSVGDRVIFRPVEDGVSFADLDPDAWGELCGTGEGD